MQNILSNRIFTTRGGTIALGAVAALLAALLLLVYLNRYRQSVSSDAAAIKVVVAERLIPKGTSAAVVASQGLTQVANIRQDQIKQGAITDPSTIKDRVATQDIYPGQQLTLADFSATTTQAVPTRITGEQRAVSISLDSTHGSVGQVQAGDRVDLYVGLTASQGGVSQPILKLLMSNVYVLAAPGAPAGSGISSQNQATNYIFRVRTADVGKLAFASEHGILWLVMRPSNGAKPSARQVITTQSLLAGTTSGG